MRSRSVWESYGTERTGSESSARGVEPRPARLWMLKPELHLGEDILVPDVAGWRRERLPRIAETWDAVIAPDWVCETMSDSTREIDLNAKRPVYAREGIPHLWLVEAVDRTLEAFELRSGQ